MGITKEQLMRTLELSKTYEDGELSAVETRLNALIQALYEVVNNNREDPIHEIHENVGLQDTPVGHIMSYMGKTAPKNYLVCDGGVYNITDYPALSSHILKEFGVVNYFGGDGETTFAVPDLRNEFLRGYHGEKDEQLSGEIGTHQDATVIPWFGVDLNNKFFSYAGAGTHRETYNHDSYIPGKPECHTTANVNAGGANATTRQEAYVTLRPTNVAVLYCIKYQPTYYLRAGSDRDYYSKEEHCIGTWINGKPLYRIVLTGILKAGMATTTQVPSGGIFGDYPTDIDEMIFTHGFSMDPNTNIPQHPVPHVHPSSIESFGYHVNFTSGAMVIGLRPGSNFAKAGHRVHLIFVYTKKVYYTFLGITILIPIRHLYSVRRKPNGN